MMEKGIGLITILQTLATQSDKSHPIKRTDIIKRMEEDHEVTMERRSFYKARCLLDCIGFSSRYDDSKKGYYLDPPILERSEELMLWNAIHSARFLSKSESERLFQKVNRFCSQPHYQEFLEEVYMPNPKKTTNSETMHNIEIAEQAILHKIKMSFNYLHFNDDLKLVNKDDDIRIIEPRYIVYADARPYLIATGRKDQQFTHYRLDRISKARLLNEPSNPDFKMDDAYVYANNKLFMFSGEMIKATIKCERRILDSMVDIFGTDLILRTPDPDHYEFSVKVNRNGILFLGQQFLDAIEIMYPDDIRKELHKRLEIAVQNYT
ncbi:helix-turn-helix transcriptional regulator [Anaerolactibacter massiliensis]|uniref:helix-turn-helix transcriptional regulator n=1 Tax=Anaerolactibacter massiliensis TaxID=2044573 RepID=UPI000CF8AD1F|nr:WYL domain-containing protein [Anaerolactibacter massiliensis]